MANEDAEKVANWIYGIITASFAFIFIAVIVEAVIFDNGGSSGSSNYSSYDMEINDIVMAKNKVKAILNYPDTAKFHNMKTRVTNNCVYLTVTAENAFGVPTTQEFEIDR